MKGKDYEYSINDTINAPFVEKRGKWGFEDGRKDERWIYLEIRRSRRKRIVKLYLYSLWQVVKIIESSFHRGNTEKHVVRRLYVAGNGHEKWDEARRQRKKRSCVWAEGKKKNRTVIVFNDGIRVDCTYWGTSN